MIWWFLFFTWFFGNACIVAVYRRELVALWKEPVFRHPIVIIESDDWGAGPLNQADALNRLTDILKRFADDEGRHPVMTIAVVLAVADGSSQKAGGAYQRIDLRDPLFTQVRQALEQGTQSGVFSLQLHGLEHYWPATLMSSTDSNVRNWLCQEGPSATEALPAHLQSRWVDAGSLPSKPLSPQVIEFAVEEEAKLYADLFGKPAEVVVPMTFVWDDGVESAWAQKGIRFVVTPGCRNTCLDTQGRPGCRSGMIRNGDSSGGVTYLVRNDYFEPEKGHTARSALTAMARKTKQGRPCLLETHRSNFLGPNAEAAYKEITLFMEDVLRHYPEIIFVSTRALGEAITASSHPLIENRYRPRLSSWIVRLEELNRFQKLIKISGLKLLLLIIGYLLRTRTVHRL